MHFTYGTWTGTCSTNHPRTKLQILHHALIHLFAFPFLCARLK
jgi:hypothetical protein